MFFAPQRFQILNRETIVDERFCNNSFHWKIIQKIEEQSFFDQGYYWMENRSQRQWMYYSYKLPLKPGEDWVLRTEIELMRCDTLGHYGLVWGFRKALFDLNRFTISADGERCVVMHFNKDHYIVHHRFHNRMDQPLDTEKITLTIMKIKNYYYFMINKMMIYICEASVFAADGPYAGYYVEPGLFVRSPCFKAERLITKNVVAEPTDRFHL